MISSDSTSVNCFSFLCLFICYFSNWRNTVTRSKVLIGSWTSWFCNFYCRSTLALFQFIIHLIFFVIFLFIRHFTFIIFPYKRITMTPLFTNFCFNLLAISIFFLLLFLVRMIRKMWYARCPSASLSVHLFICLSFYVPAYLCVCLLKDLCFHLLYVRCSSNIFDFVHRLIHSEFCWVVTWR